MTSRGGEVGNVHSAPWVGTLVNRRSRKYRHWLAWLILRLKDMEVQHVAVSWDEFDFEGEIERALLEALDVFLFLPESRFGDLRHDIHQCMCLDRPGRVQAHIEDPLLLPFYRERWETWKDHDSVNYGPGDDVFSYVTLKGDPGGERS